MSLSGLYNTVSSFMQKMKNMSKTRDARGPTLKLKVQYFGHLMRGLIGKDPDAGKD